MNYYGLASAQSNVVLPILRSDIEDGGPMRITGTVTEIGVTGSYRVCLFDRSNMRCLLETWSASDGSYSFDYIANRPNRYFVVAFDRTDPYRNAAIADFVTPEPMP